jgi:hypothetical protein
MMFDQQFKPMNGRSETAAMTSFVTVSKPEEQLRHQ